MNIRRVPIALRLFLTVLLTTLLIITVSLSLLHWTMQKNFTEYVADVELQKLDLLVKNLADVYSVYEDWGNTIQAQILQIEGKEAREDYDWLSKGWLGRQYDIALQQRYFKEHTLMGEIQSGQNWTMSDEDFKMLKENLPSQYQPFEGFRFPLNYKAIKLLNKNKEGKEPSSLIKFEQLKGKKRFISMTDRLGLRSRLSLYDAKKQFIVGEPPENTVAYRPIVLNGKTVGYLGLRPVLNKDDALSINFFSNQKRYLFLIYILSVLSSLVAALLLATYFKKPIQRLLQATQELTKGNYQHQVIVKRNDELGDLSNEINKLALLLDQHEKSRRQWVADTSHELKTPLAVLQAQIEAMQDGIRKPTTEHFASMLAQVSSLKKLTQDLADLAQAEAQQLKFFPTESDPWSVVLQEIESFKPKFEQAHLNVEVDGESTLLQLDIDRFKQIMVNLLGNAIRYTEAGGKIRVHTQQDQESWTVIVDDSPYGLTDEQLSKLGDRFYRVDDSRTRSTGGTGLGLALSCKIAQGLNGSLSFDHSPLGGLRCILKISK